MSLNIRFPKILSRLRKNYPEARCALHYNTAHELLVATILSAQCTDERVNKVTPLLFKKYKTPKSYANAKLKDLERRVYSTGFYRNKAKNIKKCFIQIVKKFDGKVPKNMEDLSGLSGVGRKTANVVLGNAFGIFSGVVVDTHVTRICNRWGVVRSKNAVIIERKLKKIVPKKDWILFSHWLIQHGRQVCLARNPKCEKCFLRSLCLKKGV